MLWHVNLAHKPSIVAKSPFSRNNLAASGNSHVRTQMLNMLLLSMACLGQRLCLLRRGIIGTEQKRAGLSAGYNMLSRAVTCKTGHLLV